MNLNGVLASESESSIAAVVQSRSRRRRDGFFGFRSSWNLLPQIVSCAPAQSVPPSGSVEEKTWDLFHNTDETAASGLDENLTLQTHDPLQHTELGKPVSLLPHLLIFCLPNRTIYVKINEANNFLCQPVEP